jgi:hypothetical protein
MKDQTRSTQLARLKTKEKKKDRMKRKHEELMKDEGTARHKRVKREGAVYKSGINMQDEDDDQPPPAQRKRKAQVECNTQPAQLISRLRSDPIHEQRPTRD